MQFEAFIWQLRIQFKEETTTRVTKNYNFFRNDFQWLVTNNCHESKSQFKSDLIKEIRGSIIDRNYNMTF